LEEGPLRRAFLLSAPELPLPALRAEGGVSREAISTSQDAPVIVPAVIVYAIIDLRSSLDHPLGDAVETFLHREDAERFMEGVPDDDPNLASYLRIEERELEAGGRN
jgi:hypothetical protein